MVLNLSAILLWVERKGSALIQDRIGANRANIFGVIAVQPRLHQHAHRRSAQAAHQRGHRARGRRQVPALPGARSWRCSRCSCTFAAVPFGDRAGDRRPPPSTCRSPTSTSASSTSSRWRRSRVYGVVLGGWASNSRWALLGGIRGSAQMISYEIAMGLALIGVVMTFGTLDLQAIARAQAHHFFGVIPAWGIIYQPLGFLIFLIAGIAESSASRSTCRRGESELISRLLHRVLGHEAGRRSC